MAGNVPNILVCFSAHRNEYLDSAERCCCLPSLWFILTFSSHCHYIVNISRKEQSCSFIHSFNSLDNQQISGLYTGNVYKTAHSDASHIIQ